MDKATRHARDQWLALRCQAGEPAAFAELVREMDQPLRYYAAKLLGGDEAAALDVLQEAWAAAFQSVRRLREPGALRPWLYRLVRAAAVDRLRREGRRRRAEVARAEQSPEAVPADDPGPFAAEDAAAIHRLLDRLTAEHREVLVLHFLEDLPVADIASVVGCPEGTVKSRLYHAKRAMEDLLTRGE